MQTKVNKTIKISAITVFILVIVFFFIKPVESQFTKSRLMSKYSKKAAPHGDCNSCHIFHNAPGTQLTDTTGNANLCMSCHNPTGAANGKPFTDAMKAVPGTGGNSHTWDNLAVNATYETNLPSNSDMLARIVSGNIICSTCHNQHSQDFPPFLRASNNTDSLCKDCHSVRNIARYSDNSSNKGSHPVGITYPVADSRFNAVPTDSVQIVSGKMECSSCHKVHYSPINNGYLLRAATGDALCTKCHTYSSHNGNGCTTCHQTHNTDKTNILMIKSNIVTPSSGTKAAQFTAETGINSFADGDATYNGVCEVCHTATAYQRNDGSSDHTHKAGANCTACHLHSNNFSITATCIECHTATTNFNTGAHNTHAVRYSYACSTCHYQRGTLTAYHVNNTADVNFDPTGLASRFGLDIAVPIWNSGAKTCDNIYCHSNGRTAYRGSGGGYFWNVTTVNVLAVNYVTTPNWSSGTNTSCNATVCHDALSNNGTISSPYTITSGGPIPLLAIDYQPFSGEHRRGAHTSNNQAAINVLCTPPAPIWNRVNCFWCHNADGADCNVPNYEGTYGTAFHVDGQTYFDPRKWPLGTMSYWNDRGAYDGTSTHCGNLNKCW